MAGKQRRAKRSRRRRKTGSKPQSEQPQKKGKGRLRKGLGAVLGFGRKAGGKGKQGVISVSRGTMEMATNIPAFGKAAGTLVLAGGIYSLGSAAATGLWNSTMTRGAPGLDAKVKSKLSDTDLGLAVQSIGMIAAGKIGASYLSRGKMISKNTADTMLAMLYGIVTYRALTGLRYMDIGSKFQYLADGRLAYAMNPRVGPTMNLPSNVQNMNQAFNQDRPYSHNLNRDFEERLATEHGVRADWFADSMSGTSVKSALFTQQ